MIYVWILSFITLCSTTGNNGSSKSRDKVISSFCNGSSWRKRYLIYEMCLVKSIKILFWWLLIFLLGSCYIRLALKLSEQNIWLSLPSFFASSMRYVSLRRSSSFEQKKCKKCKSNFDRRNVNRKCKRRPQNKYLISNVRSSTLSLTGHATLI